HVDREGVGAYAARFAPADGSRGVNRGDDGCWRSSKTFLECWPRPCRSAVRKACGFPVSGLSDPSVRRGSASSNGEICLSASRKGEAFPHCAAAEPLQIA